jgi:hypothetical protein
VLLRRLRALLALSLVSGLAWVPLGLLLAYGETLVQGRGAAFDIARVSRALPAFFLVGAACGFLFGLVFARAEREMTFDTLTLPRMAAWGALGGAVFPGAYLVANLGLTSLGSALYSLGLFAVPGALTAMTMLALARRAPPSLPAADEDYDSKRLDGVP